MIFDALINLVFSLLNFVISLLPNFASLSVALQSIFDPIIDFLNGIVHFCKWLFSPGIWRLLALTSISFFLMSITFKLLLFVYRKIRG